jgi:hypothetical protein
LCALEEVAQDVQQKRQFFSVWMSWLRDLVNVLEDKIKTWKASHWSGKERDHITLAYTRVLGALLYERFIFFIASEFSAVPLFCDWIMFDIGFVVPLELKAG